MKTPFFFVLGIVMLVSFQIISSDNQLEEQLGCYMRKDWIKMTCGTDNRFALKGLLYGSSPENCTEENVNITCTRNETHCLTEDKFWSFMKNDKAQKCSGNRECSFQATWDQVRANSCQNKSHETCYQILKGECIYEDHAIEFCKNQEVSGSKIYIHNPSFPSFDKNGCDYECDCTIKSEDVLRIYSVMFALDFNPKNCSSSLRIYNDNDNHTFECDTQKYQKIINISDSRNINLKLTKHEPWNAYQIWMRIYSENQDKVTVKCEKKKCLNEKENIKKKIPDNKEKMEEFWNGLEVIGGVIGGLIFIILIIISVLTYRRYANIATHKSLK